MDVLIIRTFVGLLGVAAVIATFLSALRTVVLPRAVPSRLARVVFVALRTAYDLRVKRVASYEDRDAVMATYGPLSLLALLQVWLIVTYFGFVAIWWSIGRTLRDSLDLSGSSLTTLGFQHPPGLPGVFIAVTEAISGLVLLALLITYLPALYSAFKTREFLVAKLEVRAGQPPFGATLLWRYSRLGRMDQLTEVWRDWENFFIDIEESHTSFPALTFFRSPQPGHSWVTASGAVLDGAALRASSVDLPPDVDAQLALRAGYIALRRICTFYRVPFPEDPQPGDPISVRRDEYDAALVRMEEGGVPLRADREAAWLDFSGWRVNYDATLLALAALTMAPYAEWSSDRSLSSEARALLPKPPRRALRLRMNEQAERERERHPVG
ncbi:hypothetical protein acdb102_07460 [Acidothermaceae bacterium B102]|nr:hypothetical protein acdb102_07460 [Acidothermaceae bacterium B102]